MSGSSGGSSLSAMASRRIQSEMQDWIKNPPEGCCLESAPEVITKWTILMQCPNKSRGCPAIYEGELFRLQVKFSDRYPLEPPEIIFLHPSPIHPHVYTNGHICLDILYDGSNGAFSPALTVSKLCLSLRSMLASNTDKSRPQGDADYCARVGSRSPQQTKWEFHDDTV
ncbi:MAG: hypothetical protein WDW38_010906 [Sanguina aurantia]